MEVFSELVGQTGAKEILAKWLTADNLPQTLLFVGPSGVGRKLAARLLAQAVHGSDAKNHPDTFWFAPILLDKRDQGVGGPIKAAADDMVRFLAHSPLVSKKKVAIVEDMSELSEEAQSALLKSLEEPRADSLIILIAESESAVLPTILSRAQLVRFVPLRNDEIQSVLPKADEDLLALADGSLVKAKTLLANKRTLGSFMDKVNFWRELDAKNLEERWAIADKLKEREAALELVRIGVVVARMQMKTNPSLRLADRLARLTETHQRLGQMANTRMAMDTLLLVL